MMRKPKHDNKAVIYARFSSHNQRDASIEQQVEWCMAMANREGLDVIDTYADYAISGRTDKRPAFQRMIRDAQDGMFSFVIAWKSNRIGRDMIDAMQFDKTLKAAGIKTLYVEEAFEDTAAGRFALRNMMNVNQFYSEALAEDVRRGMMDNAKKCMVNGRLPYGLRKGADGRAEINPEQAAIVKEIFQRVRDGWHHIDIMEDLNRRCIRNRDGREWQRTTFDKLLRNEAYIGVYKFADVRIEGGIPAILDRELFDDVQHILKTKKNPRGRHRSSEEYLLTGKLFCGHCGSHMVGFCGTGRGGHRHYYYICQGKHTEKKCSKKNVRKDRIETAVMDFLREFILNDETIDWLLTGLENLQELMARNSPLPALEAEFNDAEKSILNILDALEKGISTDRTQERLLTLERRQKELKEQIAEEKKKFRTIDADMMRFAIEKFRDKHIDSIDYQKELIRTFIKAVFVYDDHLKVFLTTGENESMDISLENLSETAKTDPPGESVCIDDTQPHQYTLIQTKSVVLAFGEPAICLPI